MAEAFCDYVIGECFVVESAARELGDQMAGCFPVIGREFPDCGFYVAGDPIVPPGAWGPAVFSGQGIPEADDLECLVGILGAGDFGKVAGPAPVGRQTGENAAVESAIELRDVRRDSCGGLLEEFGGGRAGLRLSRRRSGLPGR